MTDLLATDPYTLLAQALVYLVYGMGLLTVLVMPTMRLWALALTAARWLMRALPQLLLARPAFGPSPSRPLRLTGLSRPLVKVIQQTRTLTSELRRASIQAADWPADAAEPTRSGWRELLLGVSEGRAPLTAIRDQVFVWIGLVEALPAGDRERLAGLGVDVEAVRRTLTEEGSPAEVVRTLAGQLWGIDERLASAGDFGYRASGAAPATHPTPLAAGTGTEESDERARRGRWAGTVAEHGPGLSQMAASYSRSAADRADLEQDIALALWRALPMFRGESSLKTFAYRVARYCCFRHVRRRKDMGAAVDPASVADPAACIESAMVRADQRARIEQALTDLPDNLESVMALHLSGHSYAQIAEALGITERNVSVRLSRARARLRRQLVAA